MTDVSGLTLHQKLMKKKKGLGQNVSHIYTYTPRYWNFSCVILYLSDSTLGVSTLFTVLVKVYRCLSLLLTVIYM